LLLTVASGRKAPPERAEWFRERLPTVARARKGKSYEREDFVLDPLDYLARLDRTRSSAIDVTGFRRVHKVEEICGVNKLGTAPRSVRNYSRLSQ
jgi:hypothetical protein